MFLVSGHRISSEERIAASRVPVQITQELIREYMTLRAELREYGCEDTIGYDWESYEMDKDDLQQDSDDSSSPLGAPSSPNKKISTETAVKLLNGCIIGNSYTVIDDDTLFRLYELSELIPEWNAEELDRADPYPHARDRLCESHSKNSLIVILGVLLKLVQHPVSMMSNAVAIHFLCALHALGKHLCENFSCKRIAVIDTEQSDTMYRIEEWVSGKDRNSCTGDRIGPCVEDWVDSKTIIKVLALAYAVAGMNYCRAVDLVRVRE